MSELASCPGCGATWSCGGGCPIWGYGGSGWKRKEMITRQEMFDRAVRGLAAQNYAACVDGDGCMYSSRSFPTTERCAWGHVDPTLTWRDTGTVAALHEKKIGVAAELSAEDSIFALGLQECHDDMATMPGDMRKRLIRFGEQYQLVWPKDVPIDG